MEREPEGKLDKMQSRVEKWVHTWFIFECRDRKLHYGDILKEMIQQYEAQRGSHRTRGTRAVPQKEVFT